MILRVFVIFFLTCISASFVCADSNKKLEMIGSKGRMVVPLEDIEVEKVYDQNGQAAVMITLNRRDTRLFAEFSTDMLGESIDIKVCGLIVLRPKIMSPIDGGQLMLTGPLNTASPSLYELASGAVDCPS